MQKEALESLILAASEEAEREGVDAMTRDARLIGLILREAELSACPENRFFVYTDSEHIMEKAVKARAVKIREEAKRAEEAEDGAPQYAAGRRLRAYTGAYDFGHTEPDYAAILSLGLPGLYERCLRAGEKRNPADAEAAAFDRAEKAAFLAAFGYLDRAASTLDAAGNTEAGDGVRALKVRAPETLFEAIQLLFIYYSLQHLAEGTIVRSLGRPDALLLPFYEKDLADGRLTEEDAYSLFCDFIRAGDSYRASANMPFMLGGTKPDGETAVNGVSYLLLRALTEVGSPRVKAQILYADNTPDDFLRLALDGCRRGNNSMVFMCDRTVKAGLGKIGFAEEDVQNYGVVGCYEAHAYGETACTCNAQVSLSKVIEATLTGGYDLTTGEKIGLTEPAAAPADFEAFYRLFVRQLGYFCRAAMELTDREEKHYDTLHASPFYSASYAHTVGVGRDAYVGHGSKYNDSSVNVFSVGTAADSLAAIRKAVFEDGILTLPELTETLKNDWRGAEDLRAKIERKYPKYGNGDETTDRLAARIVEDCAAFVNGVKNVKGGVWRLGIFSIDWRKRFGESCGASPDGRRAGMPLSKNSTPSLGADREGVSASVLSATAIDGTLTPNGHTLDTVVHASAAEGEAGLSALLALLRVFDARGGFALHVNVLDAAVLREAQKIPEKYPNLQVRLCGWNVLFSLLDKAEQDEFIARTEAAV